MADLSTGPIAGVLANFDRGKLGTMSGRVYPDPVRRCKDFVSRNVRKWSTGANSKPGECSFSAKCLDQRPSPLVNSRESTSRS